MLSITSLSYSNTFGHLYQNLSLQVGLGDCLFVVGANGSGKSTLLQNIHRLDSGITLKQEWKTVLLEQEIIPPCLSVLEIALQYHPELKAVLEEPDLYAERGGYLFEKQLSKKIQPILLEDSFAQLSLGQQQWVRLISVLMSSAEVLLLDEPTNYLDLDKTKLFIHEINKLLCYKAIVIVSHDRHLMNRLATQTLCLKKHEWILVKGGYDALKEHIERDFHAKQAICKDIQKQVEDLKIEARRKEHWSHLKEKEKKGALDKGWVGKRSAKLAKKSVMAKEKSKKKIHELESRRPFLEKCVSLKAGLDEGYRRFVFSAKSVYKCFGDKILFEGLDLEVHTDDRIAILGENGCGKTTFLKCILGEECFDKGAFNKNCYINWVYLDQGLKHFFKGKTLEEHFSYYEINHERAREMLGRMLLRIHRWVQPLDSLSSGERMRAALVHALLSEAEFMILDEPTNHLDIESVEVLEQVLKEFKGGFLFVSHDAQFIKNHATQKIYLGI